MAGSKTKTNRKTPPTNSSKAQDTVPPDAEWFLGVKVTMGGEPKTSIATFSDAAHNGVHMPKRDAELFERGVAIHKGPFDLWGLLPYFDDFSVLSVATQEDRTSFDELQRRTRVTYRPDDQRWAHLEFQKDMAYYAWANGASVRRYSAVWGRQYRLEGLDKRDAGWHGFGAVVKYDQVGPLIRATMLDETPTLDSYRGHPWRFVTAKIKEVEMAHAFMVYGGRAWGFWMGEVVSAAQLNKLMQLPVTVLLYVYKQAKTEHIETPRDIELHVSVIVRYSSPLNQEGFASGLDQMDQRLSNILRNKTRLTGESMHWALRSMVPGSPPPPTDLVVFNHAEIPVNEIQQFLRTATSMNTGDMAVGNMTIGKIENTGTATILRFDHILTVLRGPTDAGKTVLMNAILAQCAGGNWISIHGSGATDEADYRNALAWGGSVHAICVERGLSDPEIETKAIEFCDIIEAPWKKDPSRKWGIPMVIYPDPLTEEYLKWVGYFAREIRGRWGRMTQETEMKDRPIGPWAGEVLWISIDNGSAFNKNDLRVSQDQLLDLMNQAKNERCRVIVALHEDTEFEQRVLAVTNVLLLCSFEHRTGIRSCCWVDPREPSRLLMPTFDPSFPPYLLRWFARQNCRLKEA